MTDPGEPSPGSGHGTVVIVGAMGSGKTSLLHALRRALAASPSAAAISLTETADCEARLSATDTVLLMGLDWLSGPLNRQQDDAWRHALAQAGMTYDVIYGVGDRRLTHALAALDRRLRIPIRASPMATTTSGPALSDEPPPRWQWRCEKCSDADCEHQLFTESKRRKQGGLFSRLEDVKR